ncbi:MAG: heat-inducible transcription repressor HrcA [Clostridia bacterium]|nr:heat-inducible transcription repressor HrcA [Clostridia bacterium]
MELSPRKEAVLAAVVRAYLQTGEPIGSKTLAAMLEHAPSSATLRNEMNALCALGLLCQPHTSAGRIPTGSGYRLYINSLMKPGDLTQSTRDFIDAGLTANEADPERLLLRAGQVLSDLTGLPAFSYYESEETVTVKRVQWVPIGGRSVMLVAVFSDGRTKSRLCRIPDGFSAEHGERLSALVKQRVIRRSAEELNKAYLQNVIASAGFDSLMLMPLLTQLFEMAAEMISFPIFWSNSAALYRICGEEGTQRLMMLSHRGEPFKRLFSSLQQGTDILLGSESGYPQLQDCCMIVSDCQTNRKTCGKIGVVGSCRMPYEQIVPSIEYTAQRLSKLLTEAQKNMED